MPGGVQGHMTKEDTLGGVTSILPGLHAFLPIVLCCWVLGNWRKLDDSVILLWDITSSLMIHGYCLWRHPHDL